MGLAAARGIVDANKWKLSVESQPGSGSTFTLLVPRSSINAGEEPSGTGHRSGRGATILVVDDEPSVRVTVQKILERAGMKVLAARDGNSALELFRDPGNAIDCVLLDLNMPQVNGEQVFAEMQSINPSIPVLMTSGFTEAQTLDRCWDAGLAGFIPKPVRANVLLESIERALSES